jgi:hypothetical protein
MGTHASERDTASMVKLMLVEGPAALDVIIRSLAPKLAETWLGDEGLVGMLVEQPGGVGIVWAPRERAIGELARRGEIEQDPQRRQRYDEAISALRGPRAQGKVSALVAGWGGMVAVELEADDLRVGKRLTTWSGGSA